MSLEEGMTFNEGQRDARDTHIFRTDSGEQADEGGGYVTIYRRNKRGLFEEEQENKGNEQGTSA